MQFFKNILGRTEVRGPVQAPQTYTIPNADRNTAALAQEAENRQFKNALFFLEKIKDEYFMMRIGDILRGRGAATREDPENLDQVSDFQRFPILLNFVIIDQLLPCVETQFSYNTTSKRQTSLEEISLMRENTHIQNTFFECHKLILRKYGIFYNINLSNYYIDTVAFEYFYSDLKNNLNVFTKILLSLYNFDFSYLVPIFVNLVHRHIVKHFVYNPSIEKYKIIWTQIINIKNDNWQNLYDESQLLYYPSIVLYEKYILLPEPILGKITDFSQQ
jgi:hypothetical protein